MTARIVGVPAGVRTAEADASPDGPRVSIVVLTYNRREEVLRTLAKLTALPEQLPIVVVDNASRDRSIEAIEQHFPHIKTVSLPKNVGASGRNHGVAATDTPYVAFCDD